MALYEDPKINKGAIRRRMWPEWELPLVDRDLPFQTRVQSMVVKTLGHPGYTLLFRILLLAKASIRSVGARDGYEAPNNVFRGYGDSERS